MATAYQPGDIIKNKYRITHVLGKGGVAITYQASDINTGLSVAIKVISLKQLENWKQVELFQREAEVLAKLEHLAIPKYIDYFDLETETDKAFYIVQQLAPGKSLFDLVESGWRTTETEVKKIAEQVLAILSYLHSLEPPVIHRDIKPNNLIRSDDGTIYLVDFGAVQNTYYNTLMQGSTVVGTYGYMAPEQFRGKAVPATDLYSLGATILYLLTHRSPSELPQDTLKLDFRSSVNISESFADWLEKILEPDLEDRFVDAEVALAELLASNKVKKQKLFTGISVGLLCLALAWGATSYKWFFLSRLGFFPDNLCSSEILESFLSQGGEIERLNFQIKNDGKILLCTLQNSLNNKNISLSQKIINKGANLNMLHNQGIDYLWNAINNKDIVFAKFLIENNINLNYPYPTNEKSILCSKNINIDLLQLMIDNGLNINDDIHSICLFYIISMNRLDIVKSLVDLGINVNIKDKFGRTPLFFAVSSHQKEIRDLLINSGADVNIKDNLGKTPLFYAVSGQGRSPEIVKLLIENGADVNAKNNYGETPLFESIKVVEFIEIIQLLIENGADVNARNILGKTPLLIAKKTKTKKILIENGADVNVKDNKGRNALFYTNNIEIIQLLIENGADVNSRDNFGKTPLTDMVIKASRNLRYIDNINLFIENGADISDLNYENIKKRYKLTSVQDSYLKSFF